MPIFGRRPAPSPVPARVPAKAPAQTAQTAKFTTPPPAPSMGGIGAGKNPNLGATFGTGFNQPSTQAKFNQMQNILGGRPMKKGGKVSSASKRADGIAKKGKTRGRMV